MEIIKARFKTLIGRKIKEGYYIKLENGYKEIKIQSEFINKLPDNLIDTELILFTKEGKLI